MEIGEAEFLSVSSDAKIIELKKKIKEDETDGKFVKGGEVVQKIIDSHLGKLSIDSNSENHFCF